VLEKILRGEITTLDQYKEFVDAFLVHLSYKPSTESEPLVMYGGTGMHKSSTGKRAKGLDVDPERELCLLFKNGWLLELITLTC
jgi:hypothetical protein